MAKFKKKAKAAPKVVYSYEAYQNEVVSTTKFYHDACKSFIENNRIVAVAAEMLEKNQTISEEERTQVSGLLAEIMTLTHQSVDVLEELKDTLLAVPEYYQFNDKKVVEWTADITAAILSSCSWVAELATTYIAIFNVLGMDENLVVPEVIKASVKND